MDQPYTIHTAMRNQEFLVAAKRCEHDPHQIGLVLDLLPGVDPYDNKCMLLRCCAQFGFVRALKVLVRLTPAADWHKIALAAVMGQQKAALEVLLPYLEADTCFSETVTGATPILPIRIAIESGQEDMVRLLLSPLSPPQRNTVLLWALEEYQYIATRDPLKVDPLVRSIDVIYPIAPALMLLVDKKTLPDLARDLLAGRLSADAALLSEIGLQCALRKTLSENFV